MIIFNPDNLPQEYIDSEVKDICKNCKVPVTSITFTDNKDGTSTQKISHRPVNFDKIRRITGYLSRLSNFNNAKKSEEHDRIIHEGDL